MRISLTVAALAVGATALISARQPNPFLGVWNINGQGQDAAIIYWLEVTEDAGQLKGMFLNRVGNPNPVVNIRVEAGELIFREGTVERPTGPEYRAKIEGGRLVGRHMVRQGGGGRRGGTVDPNAPPPPPPTEREVTWVGIRPPKWPASDANAKHTYGKPVVLFDNQTLDMWGVQNPNRPIGWSIVDGTMTNTKGANNLVSKEKFFNFKVEAEYKVDKGSNGGIYLRGRYELQVLDDANATGGRADLGHMAIYGRTPPSVKASRQPGEWQTMEAILVNNRVTVTLNGTRVHDNAIILGVTGGTLDNDELAPGPLMVQGDHSQVWFRKLVVTPIVGR